MTREVLWRDTSSGRLHKRHLVNGQLMGFEADNLDEAGEGVVVGFDVLETAEATDLCRRCFPDGPSPTPGDEPLDVA